MLKFELLLTVQFVHDFIEVVKTRRKEKRFKHILMNHIKDYCKSIMLGTKPKGDPITDTHQTEYLLYKVRINIPGSTEGKSGGLRVCYFQPNNNCLWLISMFSKREQTNLDIPETFRVFHYALDQPNQLMTFEMI